MLMIDVQPDNLNRKPLETLHDRAVACFRTPQKPANMDPARRLSKYFPEGPTPEHEKMVDVIAVVGSSTYFLFSARPQDLAGSLQV